MRRECFIFLPHTVSLCLRGRLGRITPLPRAAICIRKHSLVPTEAFVEMQTALSERQVMWGPWWREGEWLNSLSPFPAVLKLLCLSCGCYFHFKKQSLNIYTILSPKGAQSAQHYSWFGPQSPEKKQRKNNNSWWPHPFPGFWLQKLKLSVLETFLCSSINNAATTALQVTLTEAKCFAAPSNRWSFPHQVPE